MVKEAKDQIAKMVRRAPRQETRRTRISRGRRRRGRRRGRRGGRRRGRRRGRGGRRRGIDSFIHCLIQNDETPGFFQRFQLYFSLIQYVCLFNLNNTRKMWEQVQL